MGQNAGLEDALVDSSYPRTCWTGCQTQSGAWSVPGGKFWFIGRRILVSYQRVDVMGDVYLLILSLWHAECHVLGAPMIPNRTKNLFLNLVARE
ncbi:hypothetical protein PSENEW3n2_00005068 [Picochlorum sp. SENEW3]|nr:hypothetical protein PSENEW3n2_00005068 [Picochlorum sp. SENEW3]WPT17061.1 hypothetical protein PSENEW3_00005068 [Picochlorum sp. SENEW3]